MGKNKALKVAVIGVGNIAQKHLEALRDIPEAEVTTLVDMDPQRLSQTAERFEIPQRLQSHQDLLVKNRPDAVFVMVSVLKVAEVAGDFIREKIPTFLEKPPGLYTRQTRDLAVLAGKNAVPAMVGVNRRFYSTLMKGRDIILSSGPLRSVTVEAHEDVQRVRQNPKFPEEVLHHWSAANGIHALDQLRFFGGDVAHIQAVHNIVEGPMPDCCSALLKFENGALGRALMDWFAPGRHRVEVRSEGVTFTAVIDGEAAIWRRGEKPQSIERDPIDVRYKAGFFRQDQTFLQWVRDGGALPFPACTLDDAVKTMEMIDAISGR